MNKLLICLMTVLTMAFSNAHAAATNIWSGNFDVNNWRSILDIDGSKFASLQSGDKVIFKGSVSGDAQIQLADQNWSSYIPDNQYHCEAFSGTYTVSINSSNLSFFRGGIHMKGQNFILTSVSIESNGGGSDGGETGGDVQ